MATGVQGTGEDGRTGRDDGHRRAAGLQERRRTAIIVGGEAGRRRRAGQTVEGPLTTTSPAAGIDDDALLALIRRHTFRCVGCTDPLAIALVTATACAAAGGTPRRVNVRVDQSIYKNAWAVEIPGGFGHGPEQAAAAGAVMSCPDRGLLLLDGAGPEDAAKASALLAAGAVSCEPDPAARDIYARAEVETDEGTGAAELRGAYDNIVGIWRDGKDLLGLPPATGDDAGLSLLDRFTTVAEVIAAVERLPIDKLGFLLEAVDINLAAAAVGAVEGPGLAVGQALADWPGADPAWHLRRRVAGDSKTAPEDTTLARAESVLRETLPRAEALSAAAADARMAGRQVPIVGSFGSGNHGIVLFVSLGLLARRADAGDETMVRALAVGSVLVGLVKRRTGLLTPHCGCALAAAVGVAGGAVYLLGRETAGPEQLAAACDLAGSLVVADIFGIVCDGAKATCALKIASSASVALRNAYLALSFSAGHGDAWRDLPGLGGSSFWQALEAVGTLTEHGFDHLDQATLAVLRARRPQL